MKYRICKKEDSSYYTAEFFNDSSLKWEKLASCYPSNDINEVRDCINYVISIASKKTIVIEEIEG